MTTTASPSAPQINATVMASAGTGKTYMLVNRLLRLLLAGAKPDSILAVTFTRKAAAEMQSRLGERLYALAAADNIELREQLEQLGVIADTETMRQAQNLYESLRQTRHSIRTTTFHAFCQEILMRFPLEAEVPPGFTLLDGSSEMVHSARDSLLDEASLKPNGELATALQQLLDYCGSLDGLERSLATFIEHRGDWWAYTENQNNAVTFAKQRLAEQLQIEPATDPLSDFFSKKLLNLLGEFSELLNRHPIKSNAAAVELITRTCDPKLQNDVRFSACRQVFLTEANLPRSRKPSATQAKKMGEKGEARFLQLHEELSQEVLASLDRQLAYATWHACSAWYLTGYHLLEHFQRLKQEQRQLDFTDLEWSAYRLLNRSENAQWVQYKLDQRIDHLLVDEFQDTNPTQWRLLLPLLEELAAGTSDKLRSVFLVGDAKQSIYRFRRAEPRLFQTAHDWLSKHLSAHTFPLHTSWRSAPVIMDCVNRVFGDGTPLHKEQRDFVKHDTHHQELWGEVRVLPLIEKTEQEENETTVELRNPLQQPRQEHTNFQYLKEGEQIAGEIRRLIDNVTPVTIDGEVRPLRYGDIMILMRRRTHSGYYEQALRQAAIPYLGAERGTLLHSGEISDMVALLEILLTPDNNLSLATVLRCPLFACNDEDLMRLTQFDSGSWYQRLLKLAPQLDAGGPLTEAATMLQQWHQLAGKIPIHDLLDRIYCDSDLLRRYRAAYPPHLGDRVVANLSKFLELALEIDSGRYPSLGHFLSRLGEIGASSDEAPDQASTSGSGDRVRLLTIHAAKGLEASVVFLVDSAQGKSAVKPFHTMLEWPPEKSKPTSFILVGKKDQQPITIQQRLEREQQEQQRETANLLYVALTRARQLLFISGVRPSNRDESGWYFALRQALDPEAKIASESPCVLESGIMPTNVQADMALATKPALTIDQRLSQVLQVEQEHSEIAPSRHNIPDAFASTAGDEDGRLRGQLIHRLLQLLSGSAPQQWPRLKSMVAAEFGLEDNDVYLLQCYTECTTLIRDSKLDSVFQPGNAFQIMNEVPLIYRHKGRVVHGIIDRLLIGAEEAWAIDYKSHRYVTAKNVEEMSAAYRQQLSYYALGVEKLWPHCRVRSFLLFTMPRILLEV